MKILAIAKKTFIELLREPQLLLLFLFFPAILMVVYYLGFGKSDQGMAQFLKVMVINADKGVVVNNEQINFGETLLSELENGTFDGKPIMNLVPAKNFDSAKIALMEQTATAIIIIPENFSSTIKNSSKEKPLKTSVQIIGDTSSLYFTFAKMFIDDVLRKITYKQQGLQYVSPVITDFLPGTGKLSDFQFGVPGVLTFGVLFLVIITATILVREKIQGTLRRLITSSATSADILIGVSVIQVLIVLIQLPLSFGVALLCNFKSPGSLLLAMLIGVILSFCAIGLGLVVASFSKNDADAANIGSGVLIPMAFLSGTMFPIPQIPIGKIFGNTVNIYDILPSAHASEALRRVLIYGDGIRDIAYQLIAMIILTLIIFTIGILFYRRMQMSNS